MYNRPLPRYPALMRKTCCLLLLFAAAGCSSTLETGYKPTSLGASATLRRSYYASPFTPEAQAANADRDSEIDARRPHPGY